MAYVAVAHASTTDRIAVEQTLLDRVREARRSLDENGSTTERRGGDFDEVSVPYADADPLRDWLLAERARIVIEIGLAYGASALAIEPDSRSMTGW